MSSECIICALARSDLIPPYVAGVGLGEGTSASMQPARGPFQPGLLTPTRSSAAFAAGRLIPVATLALRVVRDGDGAVLRPGPFVSFCPPYRDGPNTKHWACFLLPPSNIGSDECGGREPFRFRFFGHLTVWNGGHVRTESELMYRARSPGGWRTLRIAAGSCLHCCPECVQLRTDRLGCWLVDIPAVTPPATSAPWAFDAKARARCIRNANPVVPTCCTHVALCAPTCPPPRPPGTSGPLSSGGPLNFPNVLHFLQVRTATSIAVISRPIPPGYRHCVMLPQLCHPPKVLPPPTASTTTTAFFYRVPQIGPPIGKALSKTQIVLTLRHCT